MKNLNIYRYIASSTHRGDYMKIRTSILPYFKLTASFPKVNNNLGFSLSSTLIAVGIMGISFAAMISMMTTQSREGKSIKHQLASMSLKYFMLQTLSRGNCSCQFETRFKIDTSKESGEINMQHFRSGCDTATDENIIAKENELLKGVSGVKVASVKVSKIKNTGTTGEYSGDLMVRYKQDNVVRALRPITIPLVFHVDMDEPGNNKPITSCWGEQDYSCYTVDVEASTGKTLVGCGGTSSIGAARTTALGFQAGVGSSGDDNIFIGYQSGSGLSGSNRFALGNRGTPRWLTGDMTSTGQLFLNGEALATELYTNQQVNMLLGQINTLRNRISVLEGQFLLAANDANDDDDDDDTEEEEEEESGGWDPDQDYSEGL